MRYLRVLICGCDDLAADLLTELAAVEVPLPAVTTLQPATALDELEATVVDVKRIVAHPQFW